MQFLLEAILGEVIYFSISVTVHRKIKHKVRVIVRKILI